MPTQPLSSNERKQLIWTDPWVFIACGFGVGTLPVMPGTYGTVLGVGLALLLQPLPLWINTTVLVLFFLFGVWLCGRANQKFGTDDHPAAVWDEVATFPWVMVGVTINPITLLLGFLLFRFFDIIKPGPIGWVDKNCHGGWGVMLDDWLAAVASWVTLQALIWLFG
jgi:phosphatidylglycerophosphatase A